MNMNQQKYFVIMTDRFLSKWGLAEGKIAKFIITCDSFEQAEIISRNAQKRTDMRRITVSKKIPYYSPRGYQVSYETWDTLGDIWKK
jgi:hypothetical protein